MIRCFFLLMLLSFTITIAQSISDFGTIPEIVKQLGIPENCSDTGTESGINDNMLIERLQKEPDIAVELLVKELKPVKAIKILACEQLKFKTAVHIVWCIRALRCLTSIDFRAETKDESKVDENRLYFTSLGGEDGYSFFGE